MTGIWEFPELQELRGFLIEVIETAIDESVEPTNRVQDIELERIIVPGEWGRGTAEVGQDPLEVIFVFDFMTPLDSPSDDPGFNENAETVIDTAANLINTGVIQPPEPAIEWFPGFDPTYGPIDRLPEIVNFHLGDRVGNSVFEMLRLERVVLREEGQTFEELDRVPLGDIRVEPEEEIEIEEAPEGAGEEFVPTEGPEELRPVFTRAGKVTRLIPTGEEFRISRDELAIPVGSGTKVVEDRDIFDFELRMGLPRNVLQELEGFTSGDRLTTGVGFAMELGRVGTSEPPATFPRTGHYVKNRLQFEGEAYVLEIYNDLVFYSGFISSFYDMSFKPGTYPSFREYMYRLEEIGERGGPQLIESLSQQQAAARGLEVTADHPTIEGEKAPWLEQRQYHEVVEENTDHDAWDNPTEYLYEELGTIEETQNQ